MPDHLTFRRDDDGLLYVLMPVVLPTCRDEWWVYARPPIDIEAGELAKWLFALPPTPGRAEERAQVTYLLSGRWRCSCCGARPAWPDDYECRFVKAARLAWSFEKGRPVADAVA